ncbi:MAG: DNA replication/repair protein RecF, partial [Panacagrimonas sp.]
VFHVEHRFLDVWRRYQRALKQRNRALKEQQGSKTVQVWNEELATTGIVITELRERHVAEIEAGFVKWAALLLGEANVSLEWQRGWPSDQDFREVLEQNYEQHERLGTTVQGPHRAELKILAANSKAKGRISRGQQKMLIAAMVLAQSELLITEGVSSPVLLLDDFASELAPEFQLRLAAALAMYRGQKFVSAFEVPAGFAQYEARMFHVEQGLIRAQDRLH